MTLRLEIPASEVDAARAGDAAAVDRLIEAAWPHAFRIALSILRNPECAQDAAQEACAIAYRAVTGVRNAKAFAVWFYRIVMREATHLERRRAVCRAFDLTSCEAAHSEDCIIRLDVLDAIARLPKSERACIVLHYYAGMTSREIAEILGVADGTVRFQLHRARKALARDLSDQPQELRGMASAHAL